MIFVVVVVAVNAVPKRKMGDINAGRGLAFLDCFFIAPRIEPKSEFVGWGLQSPTEWVWGKKKKKLVY